MLNDGDDMKSGRSSSFPHIACMGFVCINIFYALFFHDTLVLLNWTKNLMLFTVIGKLDLTSVLVA